MKEDHKETSVILTDTGKYYLYQYKTEQELEDMIIEHSSEIFGENSYYFKKRKIITGAGKPTITDGFVIDFTKQKLYVIEVELIGHDMYGHVLPQIARFEMALNNKDSIINLVDIFYKELPKNKIIKRDELESIVKNWGIIIIIDDIGDPNVSEPSKKTNQLMEVVEYLSKSTEVRTIPFQTYTQGIELSDNHIHSFRSFTKDELEQETKKWTFKWETVSIEKHLENVTDELRNVTLTLGKKICCIAPDVREVHRKNYITYQISTFGNFCAIKVMKRKNTLKVSLKMDESIFSDEKGIAKSIESKPSWTFDKELNVGSDKEIDYAVTLIKQAYQSITKNDFA